MENQLEIAKKLSAPLDISDIDFRAAQVRKVKNNKVMLTLLAYKDARVDMKRLDEVLGIFGWQRLHKEIKGVVYCGISINGVEKWDAGTESFSEAQKGEASDSFKRAGFNWGIGRELYDFPDMTMFLPDSYFRENNNRMNPSFKIKDITWKIEQDESGKVLSLKGALKAKCTDNKWVVIYNYNSTPSTSTSTVKGIEVKKA